MVAGNSLQGALCRCRSRPGPATFIPPVALPSRMNPPPPTKPQAAAATAHASARERWEQTTLRKALEKGPERRARFTTQSLAPVARLYDRHDLERVGFDPEGDLGFPGEFPYTRGVQPTMYRGRLWTMRQFAGFGTARETNARSEEHTS